ncbi:hypothetical protein HAHE_41610 [Haloferula helveola]|uniref:Uncharacterized protein n=1 Tax=Haloferula helveola TaxID=490095 RepID=A0ABM7RQ56_9BACT|nr:hypothetical protein HAHE_41610 [Haloferula helveola]
MSEEMCRWLILIAVAAFAACEKPRPVTDPATTTKVTPLEEVEKILNVEPKEDPPPKPPVESTDEGKPVIPVAERVPDKPGFVISPYNGKWIDVTGVPAGELMADPHFPAEDKKYFKVPELPEPPPAEEGDGEQEAPPGDETPEVI